MAIRSIQSACAGGPERGFAFFVARLAAPQTASSLRVLGLACASRSVAPEQMPRLVQLAAKVRAASKDTASAEEARAAEEAIRESCKPR